MHAVVIYTKDYCPYCDWAKQLLERKKISYQEIRIDIELEQREIMIAKSGRRTVPQIFINDMPIGGYDDLAQLERQGKLNQLLDL